MRKGLVGFLVVVSSLAALGQADSSKARWSVGLELGATRIHSLGSSSIWCYQGHLALNYRLFSEFRLGLWGQYLQYYQNPNIASIDDKIIEMSSIEYNSLGLGLSYEVRIKKIGIEPKLDIGYSIFTAKALDYDTDPHSFLDYRYLSLTPKLGIHYHFSESFGIGILGGYNMQLTALKGQRIEAFDPSSVTIGLGVRVGL